MCLEAHDLVLRIAVAFVGIQVQHSRRINVRLDKLFRRDDDTRMEALMDLADWLRTLGLERYEAAHIEPVSRKPKRKYA